MNPKNTMRFLRRLFAKFTVNDPRAKRRLLVVGLLLAVAGLAVPFITQAAGAGDDIVIFLTQFILYPIVQLLANVLIVIINILIAVAQYNGFINATAVAKGWVIVRDLCNMFFIIVLLVIAFGTILKIEAYRYNRLLGKLIIYAFLINFSKFIAGFWIDIGQVVMMTFVNGFKDAAAGNLASGLGMADMITLARETPDINSKSLFAAMMLGIGLLVIAVIVVLIMTVILLIRILVLWLLIVLAPIAFITRIFPNTAKYSDQWWGEFNKYIIVGPVMAFFLWLALTVISVNGASSTKYGFEQVSTQEQAALLEGSTGTGAGTSKTVAAAITEISTSDSLLSYMITIGLLLGALQVAQQLGVAGGKMAGSWSEKIRTGGLQAAGVLSTVAAARLAMRGAKGGAKKVGGSVRRWAYNNIPVAKFASKEYWSGVGERGQELEKLTQERLRGKGRQQMENWQYGLLKRKKKGIESVYEDTLDAQQTAKQAENEKKLGRNPGLEKVVRQWMINRERAKTGGFDEQQDMSGTLISTMAHGNQDDVYQYMFDRGIINSKNFPQFGFRSWKEAVGREKYGGAEYLRARAIQADAVNIDRKNFDPFLIGVELAKKAGKEDLYLEAMLDGNIQGKKREDLEAQVGDIINKSREIRDANTKKASEKERAALKAMYRGGEAARLGGHDEQTVTDYDADTGQAFMMDLLEQRNRIKGERSKMTGQDKASATLPHSQIQYSYELDQDEEIARDEFGNQIMYADWDPDKITPQGMDEKHDVANVQGRDVSRIGARLFERDMQVEAGSAVMDKYSIMDKDGGVKTGEKLIKDDGTEIDKWDVYKKKVGQDREAFRKEYAAKFGKAGDHILLPDEPGFKEAYQARKAANPERETQAEGEAEAAQARVKANIPEEARVPRTDSEQEADKKSSAKSEELKGLAEKLTGSVDDMVKSVDDLQNHFRDLTTNLRQLEGRLTNPEAKKAVSAQIDAVGDQMRMASNRPAFFGSGEEIQRRYFQQSSQLLQDIAKTIKMVTKPSEPAAGASPAAGEAPKPKQ